MNPQLCGGPDGKVIMTKAQARAWLRDFRARYGQGRGHIYWCPWSSAEPHYHHTKERRKGKRR